MCSESGRTPSVQPSVGSRCRLRAAATELRRLSAAACPCCLPLLPAPAGLPRWPAPLACPSLPSLRRLPPPPAFPPHPMFSCSAACACRDACAPAFRRAQAALKLWTEEREEADILHGVGLSSSSKVKGDGGGERERHGACASAVKQARAQIAAIHRDTGGYATMDGLFSSSRAMGTTHIAEILYAHACHGKRLPCSSRGCVNASLAASFWAAADRYYCDRYAGTRGGLRSSRLAMQPLLLDILGRLERSAASPSRDRISLYSGHDTVIAPLLAALGVLAAPVACAWPPYASHVVFELWTGPSAPPHVRLLYNGAPLTAHVTGCSDELLRPASSQLCPLAVFARAVRGLVLPHGDFSAACTASVI